MLKDCLPARLAKPKKRPLYNRAHLRVPATALCLRVLDRLSDLVVTRLGLLRGLVSLYDSLCLTLKTDIDNFPCVADGLFCLVALDDICGAVFVQVDVYAMGLSVASRIGRTRRKHTARRDILAFGIDVLEYRLRFALGNLPRRFARESGNRVVVQSTLSLPRGAPLADFQSRFANCVLLALVRHGLPRAVKCLCDFDNRTLHRLFRRLVLLDAERARRSARHALAHDPAVARVLRVAESGIVALNRSLAVTMNEKRLCASFANLQKRILDETPDRLVPASAVRPLVRDGRANLRRRGGLVLLIPVYDRANGAVKLDMDAFARFGNGFFLRGRFRDIVALRSLLNCEFVNDAVAGFLDM